MTNLQTRIHTVLSNGPLYPWELYDILWPNRREDRLDGPSRGGPDCKSVMIHRMMGRKGFRDLFEQTSGHLMDPNGPGLRMYKNKE